MPRSYSHLNSQERALIETQLTFGVRPAAIAAGLTRAKSNVIRELRRNGRQSPTDLSRRGRVRIACGYRCVPAGRRARLLAGTSRVPRKLVPGNPLWLIVVDHLRQGLSPAQIASTLARMADSGPLRHH